MKGGRFKVIGGWALWVLTALVVLVVAWPRQDWELLKKRLLNQQAIERMGMGGYLVFDTVSNVAIWWQRQQLERMDPAPFVAFLQAHAEQAHNPPPAAPRPRKHVIFLQLESVDGLVIDSRWEGEPIMPFVESLAHEQVYFTNTLDNTASGRTTDGEFLVLTSQVPLPRPPVFVTQQLDRIPSLPRVLGEAGYHTMSLHGFNGAFWNREVGHTGLGYDEMVFMDDLELEERIGWGWADHDILQEAARRIVASEGPLFLHTILLTNHHPYNYITERAGLEAGDIEADFVRSVRYVDTAIAAFFETLEAAGLRDDCLVVIYADHDSAITHELALAVKLGNHRQHPDTVPLVMVGFDRVAQRVDAMSGLQDVPVMVLEELGLPVPLTFTGNGWGHWGRTRSATHGGLQSTADGGVAPWEWPVDPELMTLMAIQHPERLSP